MAKTCFYCGKELAPGERCSCRGPAVGTNEQTTQASSSKTEAYSASSSASSASSQASSKKESKEEKKARKAKEKADRKSQVWNEDKSGTKFSKFIGKVRSLFPSLSKLVKPVMAYVWHPVESIQNRPQVVPIKKMILINSLFAAFTALMVLFTIHTDSPFLGMLISLTFGKTDLFSDHPVVAFFVMCAIFWLCVLILACCFVLTSRLANRRLSFIRALDTVSMSSIYMCIADALIFVSVLLGTRGAFTLIFVALVIMGIAHYVSLKQDLALSDNATFNMLAVSYLLFYTLAQLGIGILIRIVTHY
ncbi:MAG: hypothetical protein J6Y08_04975 [Clostridiales bacterium]|nr:hypothetical protein [Clostridiales bacterium]